MQKKRRFGMKNVIASVLTAALVLTSTPSGIFAGELLVDEAVESGMEGEFFEEESPNTTLPEETPEGVTDIFGVADPSEVDDFSVSEDDYSEEDGEDGTEADATDNNEVATETAVEAVTEGDTAEVSETNTEAATDAEIEFTTDAETEAEEVAEAAAAEVNTVTVEGIRGWGSTYFTAELTGATVTVSIPTYFWGTSATSMQASYVDATGYEEMIDADNYGKVVSGLKAVELTFFDKRGKVVKSVSASAEVELGSISAETYVMYQKSRTGMKKTASSEYPYFSFNISNGGPFVFAGLADDGADRAEGVTSRGTTTFDLTTSDGTEISARTSSKAFSSGTVYMEAENAMSEDTVEAAVSAVDDLEAEVVQAMDISFHNEEGTETEPAREVTVTIAIPLTMEGEYQLVHIKDNGDTEIVEDVAFDENGVTFTVDEFSTYALVWKNSDDEKQEATITWGYMDGDSFTELEEGSTVTLDTTAATVSLENTYDGYYMIGAVYRANNSAEWVDVRPAMLTKTDSGWNITTVTHNEDDTTTTRTVAVADGSEIRVIYGPRTQPVPSGADQENVPSPTTNKDVQDNGDGTYTITLDITGTQVTETDSVGANVLIIFDRTSSMAGSMPGATSRMAAAKSAVSTLVNILSTGDNAGNDIDYSFVSFYRQADSIHTWGADAITGRTTWTKNATAFNNYVQGIGYPNTYGTNWEAGLYQGRQALNSRDTDQTYVIFITDGEPNRRGTGSTTPSVSATEAISYALTQAQAITGMSNVSLYGVFCGNDSGHDNLADMIEDAHGKQTINGTDSATMTSAFENIAHTIIENLGASDAVVDDGIPSLADISANVAGTPGGYEYYKKAAGETEFTKWDEAPGAIYSEDNGVTWDLSEAGNLPAGTTYRIQFTVWPSQEAYDLLADINNGIVRNEDGSITQYETSDAAYANLSPDVQNQIYKSGGVYVLKTNTHLFTSYTAKNQRYTDQIDYREEAMDLVAEPISLIKEWPDNLLDKYGEAVYRDENGEEHTAEYIDLMVTQDKKDYLQVRVDAEHEWKKDNIFISCGLMTIDDEGNVDIKENGYDYTVTEPVGFSYYWDLISDVYHPMVINGTATLLVLDEEAESADNDNTFKIGDKFYTKADDATNTLHASNYRRSNLNLTKVVPATSAAQDNDYFTYTAKVTDAFSTDGFVWFSAYDPNQETGETDPETGEPEKGAIVTENWVLSGAEAQAGGYWRATNGAEITFQIKKEWNVRFLNLYHGSTFEFEETDMTVDYEFDGATAATKYSFEDDTILPESWYKITDKKVEGTIIEPNNQYTVTYTNKLKAFYIYHSSVAEDGDLEVIPMSDVKNGKYDLHAKTKPGTLYGGYYLNYSGKGDYKDDGVKATGGTAYNGYNKTWNRITDEVQTTSGTAMTPIAYETYYIKEVPYAYLQNYYHFTYYTSGDNKLTSLYLLSAVDDLNYSATGFYLKTSDKKPATKVVSSLTFKNNADGADAIKLTPYNVFGDAHRTYKIEKNPARDDGENTVNRLTYWRTTGEYFAANANYTVQPYWTTMDGIEVKGKTIRTMKIAELVKRGLSHTDEDAY